MSLCAARDRILSNLQKHPVPRPAPELRQRKAPLAEVPTTCLTDSKAATELLQADLSILQEQARYTEFIHTLKHLLIIRGTRAFTEIHTAVCTRINRTSKQKDHKVTL